MLACCSLGSRWLVRSFYAGISHNMPPCQIRWSLCHKFQLVLGQETGNATCLTLTNHQSSFKNHGNRQSWLEEEHRGTCCRSCESRRENTKHSDVPISCFIAVLRLSHTTKKTLTFMFGPDVSRGKIAFRTGLTISSLPPYPSIFIFQHHIPNQNI